MVKASRRKKRRIDQDLCDRARHLAGFYPLGEVARTLGLHASQVSEIKKRGWKATKKEGVARRPRPDDLEEAQARMTFAELCERHGCGNSTMIRWLDELPSRRPSWRGDPLRNEPRNGGASRRKPQEDLSAIRAKQWETRRAKYGPSGHRAGAYAHTTRRDDQ